MPTNESMQFSRSGLLKHLTTGSVRTPHHFLTTWTESCGFIMSLMQSYTVHMKLTLRLSFLAQVQPRGLHGGHHRGISNIDHGGLSPKITPLNPAVAPTTSYEYLFCLPSSDWLWPPTRWKARGYCQGLVPRVLWVINYGPIIHIWPVPTNSKWLRNHAPHTEYDTTTPG
jgi:hypothetical protein